MFCYIIEHSQKRPDSFSMLLFSAFFDLTLIAVSKPIVIGEAPLSGSPDINELHPQMPKAFDARRTGLSVNPTLFNNTTIRLFSQ